MVQVVVGEQKGEGVRMGTRCLWDTATDSMASETVSNVRSTTLRHRQTCKVPFFKHGGVWGWEVAPLCRTSSLPLQQRMECICIEQDRSTVRNGTQCIFMFSLIVSTGSHRYPLHRSLPYKSMPLPPSNIPVLLPSTKAASPCQTGGGMGGSNLSTSSSSSMGRPCITSHWRFMASAKRSRSPEQQLQPIHFGKFATKIEK